MCDKFLENLEWLLGIARGAAVGGGGTEGANRTRVGAEFEARSRAYNQGFFGAQAAQQQALNEAVAMGAKRQRWEDEFPGSTAACSTVSMMYPGRIYHGGPEWVERKIAQAREAEKIPLTPQASIRVDGEARPVVHPGAYKPIEGYQPIEHEKHEDFAVRLAARGGSDATTQAAIPVRDSLSRTEDKGRTGE